jgi:hypothetical protein
VRCYIFRWPLIIFCDASTDSILRPPWSWLWRRCVFVAWLLAWLWLWSHGDAPWFKKLVLNHNFNFEPPGEKGAFEKLLANYLDIAKVIIGLASGSIVLLVGSASFRSTARLSASFASPMCLLALSILYGVLFMVFEMLNYEDYRHGTRPYTRFKYSRNLALGFGASGAFVWAIYG